MHPLPHQYTMTLEGRAKGPGILTAPSGLSIEGGPPPEFDGSDQWWSPEHLLLAATSLCLWTTFQALAARKQLVAFHYRCETHATLDKTSAGLAFTAIRLRVSFDVASAVDVVLATELVRKAERMCLVSNSLKTPVTVDVDIGEIAARPLPGAASSG